MSYLRATPLFLLLAAGCRPDPGTPDYTFMEGIVDAGPATEDLAGPSPYVPGTPRLSLGLFYEGGASERLPLDATRHYYVFAIEGSSTLTYSQEVTSDRVEGRTADALRLAGTPWWGGGILYDTPEDFSRWTTLHVSLQSPDDGLAGLELRMQHGASAVSTVSVNASSYGWRPDGTWHHLAVPLADFTAGGLQLSAVRGALLLGGTGGKAGEQLVVDNLYVD